MLGLYYAINYPNTLDHLIVVGAAASNEYMRSIDSIYCSENPKNHRLLEILSILKSSDSSNELKAQAAREWTEMSLHYPEKWDKYFSKLSSGGTVQKRLDYYNRYLSSFDIRNSLNLIKTRTLVMCGRYDAQCPISFSEEIHRLIEGSKLRLFEDSNHSPHIEEPENFKDVINRFFN
ncbi:alpha/beta fold hydrolase [Paenibacillus tarimensis]